MANTVFKESTLAEMLQRIAAKNQSKLRVVPVTAPKQAPAPVQAVVPTPAPKPPQAPLRAAATSPATKPPAVIAPPVETAASRIAGLRADLEACGDPKEIFRINQRLNQALAEQKAGNLTR